MLRSFSREADHLVPADALRVVTPVAVAAVDGANALPAPTPVRPVWFDLVSPELRETKELFIKIMD